MTTLTSIAPSPRSQPGAAALSPLAVLAFLDSLFEYFWPANGIHGTDGALLVVVSTLLVALAAGVLLIGWGRGWLGTLLRVLIFIDIWCTAAAAYFLENWILLALLVLSLVAFMVDVLRPKRLATDEASI